jgi:hypothetical protein
MANEWVHMCRPPPRRTMIIMRVGAAVVLPLLLLLTVQASDRLVEFSSRTLPRLDQLQPATVPTVMGEASAAPAWAHSTIDLTLRPRRNEQLCLHALAARTRGDVALRACTNTTSAGQAQQWHWSSAAGQLALAGTPELCVTSTPIGTTHTLSLVSCDDADGGSRWQFLPGTGQLLTRGGKALYADSVHPGVRDVLERLEPLLRGVVGTGDRQVLMGCFGWMMDLALEWSGDPQQQLPIVNPESPQWSRGNATYADLQLLTRELGTAAAARGLHRLKLGVLFVGWAKLYNLQSGFAVRHPELCECTPCYCSLQCLSPQARAPCSDRSP